MDKGQQFKGMSQDFPGQAEHTVMAYRPGAFGQKPAGYATMTRRKDQYTASQTPEPDGQIPLFDVYKRATPWRVTNMAVRKGNEHLVGSLLGMSAEHSMKTTGALPEASSNLSKHSSRIVDRLSEKGIISSPASNQDDLNDITKRNARGMVNDTHAYFKAAEKGKSLETGGESSLTDYSPADVYRGSSITRSLLRASRPAKPKQAPVEEGLW